MLYGRLPTTRRSGRKRREIELERVGLVQRELRRRERLAQPGGQVAVDFDGGDVAGALDQPAGERGQPRPDLDDVLAAARIDGVDDARRRSAGRRGNSGRSACGRCGRASGYARQRRPRDSARSIARSTAANRLPGSAVRASAGVARQVERRAVIDRRARKRQAERHVDALPEARRLQHGQSLVVIHRDDRVVVADVLGHEERVGGQRAGDAAPAVGARVGDRRRDDVDFLAAQVAAFAGVRIEPAHGDARRGDAELRLQFACRR